MTNKKSETGGKVRSRKSKTHSKEMQAILQQLIKQIRAKSKQPLMDLLEKASMITYGGERGNAIEFIGQLFLQYADLSIQDMAYLTYLRAYSLRELGQNDEALVEYNRAIDLKPEYDGLYYLERAQLKKEMGDLEGSQSDFEKGAELNPDIAEYFEESEE